MKNNYSEQDLAKLLYIICRDCKSLMVKKEK